MHEKLRRIGLEIMSDEEAGIPAPERGRYLACRVIQGAERPALSPHAAGYLFVAVETDGAAVSSDRRMDAEVIRAALAAWRPGETLRVRVRRNPYLLREPQWWERQVTFLLPAR